MPQLALPDQWLNWAPKKKLELLAALKAERERLLRAEKSTGALDDTARAFLARYQYAPALFAEECIAPIRGDTLLAPYQAEILDGIPAYSRMCVRGPHGLGKSTTAALFVIWFAVVYEVARTDWKVITTASVWRQLTKFLWPEIHKWARQIRWEKIPLTPWRFGKELTLQSLNLDYGQASAVASDQPTSIEGAHATAMAYVFDESKAIGDPTWQSAEGAFSTQGIEGNVVYALAISTPGEPHGMFFDIQRRAPGTEDWHARHVTRDEAIAAGRMGLKWAEQKLRQWGLNSPVYQNRVLGEFAASDEDAVIPLSWVEKAVERWNEWHDRTQGVYQQLTTIGVDVARTGEDLTVIAPRDKWCIPELRPLEGEHKFNVMHCVGVVKGMTDKYGGVPVVDVVGLGAGVYDRLVEMGVSSVGFVASGGSDARDKTGELGFANRRSEAWWKMRELLDPNGGEEIMLPPHDLLIGDLTAPHWRVESGGRIRIEGKDDAWSKDSKLTLRERLKRSTDHGDAVVQAFVENGGTIVLPFNL